MFRYAGIGSRKTPKTLKLTISTIASYLSIEFNAVLVSGGASGADSFFEEGCDQVNGQKEIWLPELGFNGHSEGLLPSDDAYLMAPRFVPHWKKCKPFAKNAHARNCHQILGADLMTPVSFVVCWTPQGELVGGTATALRIAIEHDVPILNLGKKVSWSDDEIEQWLNDHCSF